MSAPKPSEEAPTRGLSNAWLRVLTAVVGIPAVLGVAYLGGWPFALVLMGAALLAQMEAYRMMSAGGMQPYVIVGLLMGAMVGLRALIPEALPLVFFALIVLLLVSPFVRPEGSPLADLSATVFGVLYPTAALTFLLDLRMARGETVGNTEAFWLTLATLVLIWAADSFAYFAGKSFGRHKFAPLISPKKTWEGYFGGVVGAVVVAGVLGQTVLGFVAWPHLLVMALLCGAVSPFGDLAESRMKRAVGVKDSGNLLPGHGGLLDRVDALLIAAPLVYLYLKHFAQLFGG